MRSLVKGYGDTHERGRAKFDKLAALVPRLRGQDNSGARLEGLIKAALADEGDEPWTRPSRISCDGAMTPRFGGPLSRRQGGGEGSGCSATAIGDCRARGRDPI